jgi:hypothetical protein
VNYSKIYNDLIESAKLRPNLPLLNGYTEKHHIIPRSMGGSNSKDNIVSLTAREHFVAHWLLWRIHRNKEMAFAFSCMFRNNRKNIRSNKRYWNGRAFQEAKEAMAESLKGRTGVKHTEEAKQKIAQSKIGKKASSETREKLSNYAKNRNPEHREKIAKSSIGRKASKETLKKLSAFQKGRQKSEEHRRKIGEANRRRVVTQETKDKLSRLAKERYWRKLEERGELPPPSPKS